MSPFQPSNRKNIPETTREFVIWSQDGMCLLCSCRIGLKFHHVIAHDIGGSVHWFNLVAICATHHELVETVKRRLIPDYKLDGKWLARATSAKSEADTLANAGRQLLDILTEQPPTHKQIPLGVPEHMQEEFAKDLIREDATLLHEINIVRPRIFLGTPSQLESLKMIPGVDDHAKDVVITVRHGAYVDAISEHLENLRLPYCAQLA